MCERRNLPPKPELNPCECGKDKPEIHSWTIVAEYFVKCPDCGRYTEGFLDDNGKHGLIRAAEAWNAGLIQEPDKPVHNNKTNEIIARILLELAEAEKKHPSWPTDAIHAAAILAEEVGELVQSANDFHYFGESHRPLEPSMKWRMEREAIQCGAMAIRFLLHLDEYESWVKE